MQVGSMKARPALVYSIHKVSAIMDPRLFPSLFSWPARFALGP